MALALAAMMALAACGAGSGEGLESTPNCPSGVLEPNWGCIQDFVFTPRCVVCHSGATAPKGLKLDSANSQNIVGTQSKEELAYNLIEPFDPDASYLIKKVRGDLGITCCQMPLGGPFLDATTILTMEDWVTLGAPLP